MMYAYESDAELSVASGASTSSAPVSILTGADEERSHAGIVGGNGAGSLLHHWFTELPSIAVLNLD